MACAHHVDDATRPPPDNFVCGRGGGIRQRHTRAGRLVGRKRSFAAFFRFSLAYGKFCGENIYRRGGARAFSPCKCALECVCEKEESEKKRRASTANAAKASPCRYLWWLFLAFRAHPSSIKHVVDGALVSSWAALWLC